MADSETRAFSYDTVPYPSYPFRQTHPDRLATIARLFGLQPPGIDRCRVLEIGAASGGNLIPMAEQLPQSQFVGIDLAASQVDLGQQFARRAGLSNVELKAMNILEVDDRLGMFDYIICHGIYSWVPDPAQDKILDIAKRNLSPQGVAYISYNTYPGWHMRGMIREMMSYHTDRFSDSQTRIQQARNLLDFLAQNASQEQAFGMLLNSELNILRGHSDAYLFHEHLEDCNSPSYFFQFARRAAAKGLQYLGEAEMSSMWTGHLPPAVAATVERVAADLVQMEQYIDFVRNRMFRQTLLCHEGLPVNRELKPDALGSFHFGSGLVPTDPKADLRSYQPLTFQRPASQLTLTTQHPLMKGALVALAKAWPGTLPFPRLVPAAYARLGQEPILTAERLKEDSFYLGKSLLECYVSDLVEIHSQPPCFTTQVPVRPLASRVARAQAEAGESSVTNLRHELGQLNEFCGQVLRLLDGTRDRAALLDGLAGLVGSGVLVMPQEGLAGADADTRKRLEAPLDRVLHYLAWNAFLLAAS